MSKTIKLTQEELKQLTEVKEKRDQIVYNLGQVDIQRAMLEGQRSSILENLAKLQEEETKVGKELQEKYGNGNINIETGEFTSED